MQELLGLLGYALALVATLAAWIFWRKISVVQQTIDGVIHSRDEMALAGKDLRQELDQFKDRLEKSQAEVRKLRDQVAKDKTDSKAQSNERTNVLTGLEDAKARAERRADNFEAQCESLLKQTRAAEQLRSEAEKRFNDLSQDFERKVQLTRETAESRNIQLRQDIAQMKADFEALKLRSVQLEEMTKLASPEDLKRLRRKVGNLEHLLMSMRGLKEMAEERNQNWELALRILSTAALKAKGASISDAQLGPLVGSALEAVGDTLVRDEWTVLLGNGSTPASSESTVS